MTKGLLAEVESLIAKGYGLELPSMSGLGYRQIGMFLQGQTDLADAVQQIKYNTHRFARHQYNWFRLKDERIHWVEIGVNMKQGIQDTIQRFLADRKVGD